MFNKILIIGCGLIGSSILRASIKKKISKKVYILEKSNSHIKQIKKLKIYLMSFSLIVFTFISCGPNSKKKKRKTKFYNIYCR